MNKNEVVRKLNILINEAICHGADGAGSYAQNEEKMVKAIESVIKALELEYEYEVVNCKENNIDLVGIDISWGDWFIVPKSALKDKNNSKTTYVNLAYKDEWNEWF